jgi:tetratricopeptide (TPR) repeat protein
MPPRPGGRGVRRRFVTPKIRLFLRVGLASAMAGTIGVALAVALTWPQNSLGGYLKSRENHNKIVRALEDRIAGETDPAERAFYQSWLAEERGELAAAIAGFQDVRDRTGRDGPLYVRATLRLGQSYGRSGDPERELATYEGLMERHPGAGLLGQIFFRLRRGERAEASALLDVALRRDAQDGSLGHYRDVARQIQNDLQAAGYGTPAGRP